MQTARVVKWSGTAVLITMVMVLAGCGADSDDDFVDEAAEFVDEEPLDEEPLDDEPTAASGNRDDVDCSYDALGADDTVEFTSARYVVDGQLGDVCYGDDEALLVEAWNALAIITPELQLTDLALFGAFESSEDGDEVTLAFVNSLDDDGSVFQMSVNLKSFAEDEQVALLTMAHEFAHVFTSTSTQIDRSSDAGDNCSTYFNGEGCFLDDSLMANWINEFWGDLIDEIDPYAEVTVSDGEDRCALNEQFYGPYAASNPEEDFAESFSAYVFDVAPANDDQAAKMDWIDQQSGLSEFYFRAADAGLLLPDYEFEPCG
jgi:hypothetical protein